MKEGYRINDKLAVMALQKNYAKLIDRHNIGNYCYQITIGNYKGFVKASGIVESLESLKNGIIFDGYHNKKEHKKEVNSFERQLKLYLGVK